jgi:flavin-dependent dehydrogenase
MKGFDAIIIGAGQAGPSLAGRLTGAGMTVALVERKLLPIHPTVSELIPTMLGEMKAVPPPGEPSG